MLILYSVFLGMGASESGAAPTPKVPWHLFFERTL